MLTVHHLGISQSDRIVWLCEELGISYELKHYVRDPVTRLAPQAYRDLHPFGTAPVVTDGDLVLGESAAIIEYVCSTYAGGRLLIKCGEPDYAQFLFWFHFANGSMMPSRMFEMIAGRLGDKAKGMIDPLLARSDRAFDMIDARLQQVDYLAGSQFTAADIMMLFPLTTMREFAPRDMAAYPNIRAYLRRIAARPAFRRAMSAADPDYDMPLG